MIVNPGELCSFDFHVKFLSVNITAERPSVVFSCTKNMRKWDRFFYVTKGVITFEHKTKTITAQQGDIVYLPYDSVYRSKWSDENKIGYITVEFILFDENNERFSLGSDIDIAVKDKNLSRLSEFRNLYETWVKGEVGYRIKAKAEFLELLRKIALGSIKADLKHSHRSIYKAIIYIENNYIGDISVEELAKMCGMCQSYFREAFREYAGMPPIRYKNYLRAKKARELLETGEYTVGEAAEMVGFGDISYFNRIFRSFFKKSPKSAKITDSTLFEKAR